MSKFKEIFATYEDFDFEISNRSQINLESVITKLHETKLEKFIIDISINGYSSKDSFDFEIKGKKWSEVKHNFKVKEAAQKDPNALTVKRAIRVMSKSTTDYIKKKKIVPSLSRYNLKAPHHLCHLGSHFSCTFDESQEIINLWLEFDKIRKTKISESVIRILSMRFG